MPQSKFLSQLTKKITHKAISQGIRQLAENLRAVTPPRRGPDYARTLALWSQRLVAQFD